MVQPFANIPFIKRVALRKATIVRSTRFRSHVNVRSKSSEHCRRPLGLSLLGHDQRLDRPEWKSGCIHHCGTRNAGISIPENHPASYRDTRSDGFVPKLRQRRLLNGIIVQPDISMRPVAFNDIGQLMIHGNIHSPVPFAGRYPFWIASSSDMYSPGFVLPK